MHFTGGFGQTFKICNKKYKYIKVSEMLRLSHAPIRINASIIRNQRRHGFIVSMKSKRV